MTRNIHAQGSLEEEGQKRDDVNTFVVFRNIHNNLEEKRRKWNTRSISEIGEYRKECYHCEDDGSRYTLQSETEIHQRKGRRLTIVLGDPIVYTDSTGGKSVQHIKQNKIEKNKDFTC